MRWRSGVGTYVARIVEDGDTLQVGYGSMPNAALACLFEKKHLGIHTELLTDGIVDLMKAGVVDNTPQDTQPRQDGRRLLHGPQEHLRVPARQPNHGVSAGGLSPTTPSTSPATTT